MSERKCLKTFEEFVDHMYQAFDVAKVIYFDANTVTKQTDLLPFRSIFSAGCYVEYFSAGLSYYFFSKKLKN